MYTYKILSLNLSLIYFHILDFYIMKVKKNQQN